MFSVFWPHTLASFDSNFVIFSRVRREILFTLFSRNVDLNFLLLQKILNDVFLFAHAALLSSVLKRENFHL